MTSARTETAASGDPYDEPFDFPPWDGEPKLAYAICSTMRSGSSLLSLRLWETGLLGAPWEYFNPVHGIPKLSARTGAKDLGGFVGALFRHRTSPNGVFGVKLHPEHVRKGMMPLLRLRKHIVIERDDKVAQAVSLARAVQTRQWASRHEAAREPQYDYAQLFAQHQRVLAGTRFWRRALSRIGAKALRVTYEELVADTEGAVRACAAHLGVSLLESPKLPMPPHQKMADALNDEWKRRYLEDFSRYGVPAAPKPGARRS